MDTLLFPNKSNINYHNRVMTNQMTMVLIILVLIGILVAVAYVKFFKK